MQGIPEFSRERDARLRMLVNSAIREVDRIGRGEKKKESLVQQNCGRRGGM